MSYNGLDELVRVLQSVYDPATHSLKISGSSGGGASDTVAHLTITDPASRIIPGATSFAVRNHADSQDNFRVTDVGDAFITNKLEFVASVSQVVPGVTSFAVRNNADNANNLLISDAGGITLRGNLTYTQAVVQIVPGATSYAIRNNANSQNNVLISDIGKVTIGQGSDSSNKLLVYDTTAVTQGVISVGMSFTAAISSSSGVTTAHYRGDAQTITFTGSDSLATFSAVYANAFNNGTGGTISHFMGVCGVADLQGTAGATVMTGGYFFDNFSTGTGAVAIVAAGYFVHGGYTASQTAGQIAISAGIYIGANVIPNTGGQSPGVVVDAYGLTVAGIPSGASGNNVGLSIGSQVTGSTAGAISKLGLLINEGGAWFKGQMATPLADTSNKTATMAIQAGDNGVGTTYAVLCALYFYKGVASSGYIGFDNNTSVINAGHTKLATDLVIGSTKLLVDTNGQIYAQNSIRATTGLYNVQAIVTTGTIPTALTITTAAHTTLNNTASQEVYFNFNQTKQFIGGGANIATMDEILINVGTYSAASAQIIDKACALRITRAPVAGTNMTITASWAICVDAGATQLQAVTVGGTLTMSTAVSKLVPGATSFSHRNNADSADNILITDAGVVTFRSDLNLTTKVIKYNNIATVGWGVPAIYGQGRSTAQTAAVASVATYTVGAADGTFKVSCNVNVTASTTHSFTVTVTYTDETNTSRTLTLNVSQLTGAFITAITNVTGVGPYEGVPVLIRCKASTAITIATVGTFTSVTYNVEGMISQFA